MPDTKVFKAQNNESGTFAVTLSAAGASASLSAAPANAPGVIVAEAGTSKEEHIYYATKDPVTNTISGLIRDYTNLNGGIGQEHLGGVGWETLQAAEFINNIIDALKEGYVSETSTIAYVSSTQFTVTGDQTSVYTVGRVLRYNKDNTKIGLCASASYNSGTGLTTVTTNSGTVPTPLTSVEYSIQPKNAAIASGVSVQNSSFSYADDTGAANAYAITLSPVPSAYIKGMLVFFKATNANTTAATLNVNSLGVKSIKRRSGNTLLANDIVAGQIVVVAYDGTNFILLSGTLNSITADTTNADLILSGNGTGKVKATALYGAVTTDVDGATITLDCSPSGGNRHEVILGAIGRALALSNYSSGQMVICDLIEDGTGSRTVTQYPQGPALTTTITLATPGVLTTGVDIPSGTPVILTTTGALPTGITAGTVYWYTRVSSTTGNLSTSLANCQAGTLIATSGSQSGVHTLKTQVRWFPTQTTPTLSPGKFVVDTLNFYIKDAIAGVIYGFVAGQGG